MFREIGRWALTIATALPILATAAPAANEELRTKLDKLAAAIEQKVPVDATSRKKELALGDISGPPQADANGGPGIAAQLADALASKGVKVHKNAKMTLRGRYATVANEAVPGMKSIRLTAELFDEADQNRGTFTTMLHDTATIAALLGTTVSLSPDGDLMARNLEVIGAAEKPQATIQGTRIQSKPNSPFALEILVRPASGQQAAAREPTLRDGQPYVALERGESYELRLHNAAPYSVAATVTIDGIDSFRFSEERGKNGQPRFSFYPVRPSRTLDVPGWFHRLDRSKEFLVTAYGEGASSALPVPQQGKTGVITVTFQACADSKDKLPANEQAAGRGGPPNETGEGPDKATQFKPVTQVIGTVRDVISVRYTH